METKSASVPMTEMGHSKKKKGKKKRSWKLTDLPGGGKKKPLYHHM